MTELVNSASRGRTISRSSVGVNVMRQIQNNIHRLLADQAGTETIEYALVLGLIVVTAIAVIGAVGTRVVARWSSVNSTL